jgi:hypothetical protein
MPGYMYCFLPSYEATKGTVQVYSYIPDIVLDFLYFAEIEKVRKILVMLLS